MNLKYEVKYSDRKSIGLIVDRDKKVIVRAPKGLTEGQLKDFVEKKKYWLFKKIHNPHKSEIKSKTEFISGASIMYLGRTYKLDLTKAIQEGIYFDGGFKISNNSRNEAFDLLKKWYLKKANEKIVPKTKYHAANLGVQYREIKVSEVKYRWGSCTPRNNLIFNWRLIKAPLPVIEYVIVHELAHLIEPNHTQKFWRIVRVQLPQYEKSREWLRDNGRILEVDL